MLVDVSELKKGENLVRIPKSATNISLKKVTPKEIRNIRKINIPQRTLAQRLDLIESIKQKPERRNYLENIKYLLADVNQAVGDLVSVVSPDSETQLVDVSATIAPEQQDQSNELSVSPTGLEPTSQQNIVSSTSDGEQNASGTIDTATVADAVTTTTDTGIATDTGTTTTDTGIATDNGTTTNGATSDQLPCQGEETDNCIAVEYTMPAPVIQEQSTDTGKLIIVSAPDEAPNVPLMDVLAATTIPKIFKVGQEDKIHIKWKNNGDQNVTFHASDTNDDGYLDYIEWTVPHLSEQIFEIIFISKAFQLDQNQNIVADIYDTVATQDSNYATITDGQYVRATFEQVLTSANDITIFARPTTPSSDEAAAAAEVYPVYTDAGGNQTEGPQLDLVNDGTNPDFSNINYDGKYRILLQNLQTPTDVFDLKFLGSVDVDYIVDPSTITSTATGGVWATGSTWVGGVAPGATDTAVIATTGTGKVTFGAAATIAGITINTGATLTANSTNLLTVNGPFVNNGTFTNGSGKVTFGGATAAINAGTGTGNFYALATALAATTLTINTSVTCATLTFGASTGAVSVTIADTNSLTVSGAVTITAPGTGGTNQLSVNAGTLSAASIAINSSTGGKVSTLSLSTGTITVTGNITASASTSVFNVTSTGTINAGGTFLSGAGKAITFNYGTGTVNFNGTTQSIAPYVYTFNNVTLSSSGAKTTTNAIISGILSIEGTATTAGTIATYGAGTTLQYKGSASQTTGIEFPATFSGSGGVIINNSSGVTMGAAKVISNGLNIVAGTFTVGAYALTVTGATTISGNLTISNATGAKIFGDITVNTGGTFNNSSANEAITVNGSISNNQTFTSGTGTYTLAGTTKTLNGALSFTGISVSGTYTNNGTTTVSTTFSGAGTFTNSGTLNIGAASVGPTLNGYPVTITWIQQTGSGLYNWYSIASSADGTKLVAAVNNDYIYTSIDSGVSWTQQTGSGMYKWQAVASSADGTKLVAGVSIGYIYTSADSGVTWTRATSAGSHPWQAVASSADGTKLAAAIYGGTGAYIYTSADSGVTWVQQTGSGSDNWYSIASSADGTKLVAGLSTGYIYTSADSGVTWVQQTGSISTDWYAIVSSSDGTKLAAADYAGYIYTSPDSGVTWTQQTGSGSDKWYGLTSSADGTKLAAASNGGYIYTSVDSGVTWTQQTSAGTGYWSSITSSSDGTKLAAVGATYVYTGVAPSPVNTINYNSASLAQTIKPTPYYNLSFNNTGQIATLGGNATVGNTLTITSGTLAVGANNLTVSTMLSNSGLVTVSTGTLSIPNAASGNFTFTDANTIPPATYSTLTINASGHTDTLGGAITVTDLAITAGTLDATASSYGINLAGNWTNSGTFTAGTGTVTLNGTTQTISGSTTFNNLTIDKTNSPTISFTSGTTQTIGGAFTATGDSSHHITIASTATSVANLSQSSGTVTCAYCYISYSAVAGGATWDALTSAGNVDNGHNTGWVFSVANTAPAFTAGPSDGGSYSGAPTNVGSNVNLTSTATDPDGNNYYLAVCKTNSITAVNNGAPTCGGGNWCVSGSTSSGSGASCNYTTLSGDAESNGWYAFACDYNATSACSAMSQASGNNGSPFSVNHAPAFSAVSDSPDPLDPGTQITFSSTASDPDSDGSQDQVTLFACKLNDFTGTACGAGGEWCHSSASASNPSCNYTTAYTDGIGAKNYYANVIDNHNLASASNPRSSTFTINNVLPAVSAVSIDSGAASVNLMESTTKNVSCAATVTDNNSYSDITTMTAKLYRSGVGAGAGDDNSNHYTLSGSKATYCSGSGTSGTCAFTFPVQYYAEPTDAGSTYSAQNWVCQVTPSDNVGVGTANTSTIEMNTLKSFDVSSTITYGSLVPGQNTTGSHTATVTNTGNVSTGFKVSGNDLSCSVLSSVPVSNQQFGTSSFSYGAGTALSGTAVDTGASLAKPTQSTPTVAQDSYWQLTVPAGTKGSCSGATSFIAN